MSLFKIRLRQTSDGNITGYIKGNIDSEPKKFQFIPISAFLISILSLGFSIDQGMESRQHDRLSVLPHMALSRFGFLEKDFGISIENDGAGLAIIKRIDIEFEKSKLDTIEDLRRELLKRVPSAIGELTYTEVLESDYYTPVRIRRLIRGTEKIVGDSRKMLWDEISNRLEIKITYCSVYDDCWSSCLIAQGDACATFHTGENRRAAAGGRSPNDNS